MKPECQHEVPPSTARLCCSSLIAFSPNIFRAGVCLSAASLHVQKHRKEGEEKVWSGTYGSEP